MSNRQISILLILIAITVGALGCGKRSETTHQDQAAALTSSSVSPSPRAGEADTQSEAAFTGAVIRLAASDDVVRFLQDHAIAPSIYESFLGPSLEQARLLWGAYFQSNLAFVAPGQDPTRQTFYFYSPYSDVLAACVYSTTSQRIVAIAATPAIEVLGETELRDGEDVIDLWRRRIAEVDQWVQASESAKNGERLGWPPSEEHNVASRALITFQLATLAGAGFGRTSSSTASNHSLNNACPRLAWSFIRTGEVPEAHRLDTPPTPWRQAAAWLEEMPRSLRSTVIPVMASIDHNTDTVAVCYVPSLLPSSVIIGQFSSVDLIMLAPASLLSYSEPQP